MKQVPQCPPDTASCRPLLNTHTHTHKHTLLTSSVPEKLAHLTISAGSPQPDTHACTLHCFSRVRLCNPMDRNLPGSSVYGILQARILEWAAIPFSLGSSLPRDGTWVYCIAGKFFRDCLDFHHCPMSFHIWFVASRCTSSTPCIWIKCLSL